MKDYQKKFIEFLMEAGVLTFGTFTLKSGRIAPYFINAGKINNGSLLARLSEFYAQHIIENNLLPVNCVFGPAYKGIPLAVSTVLELNKRGFSTNYCFDRKEEKTHGDKGFLVGYNLKAGDNIILVDDVISGGITMNKQIPLITDLGVIIKGIVVLVDRGEKGSSNISAINEIENKFKIKIYPIVTIHDIISHVSNSNSVFNISEQQVSDIKEYLNVYGA